MSRDRCALVTLLVAALVGCGGDGGEQPSGGSTRDARSEQEPPQGWPDPAETPEEGATRLVDAASAEDCSAPEEIFHQEAVTPRLCKRILASLDLDDPSTVRAFGSGAVLRNEDGRPTILVLDSDGRYKLGTTLRPDLPSVPVERADKTADGLIPAIFGAGNFAGVCRRLLYISLRFGPRREWCRAHIRRLIRTFGATSASPTPLGGDGTVAFHGVRAYRRPYVTLLFVAHESGRYLFVESWPAGRSKWRK